MKLVVVYIWVVMNCVVDNDGKMILILGSEGVGFIYWKDGYVIINDYVVSGVD